MARLLATVLLMTGLGLLAPSPAHATLSVTISATRTTLMAGESTTIKGKAVGAKPGSVVTLQRKASGVWKTVKEKKASSTRTYSFTITPPKGYRYYRVRKPAQLGQAARVSSVVRLRVVSQTTIATRVELRRPIDADPYIFIDGGISSLRPGAVIHLQGLVDGIWSDRSTFQTIANDFYFIEPLTEHGPERVYIAADALHTAATAPVQNTSSVLIFDGVLGGQTVQVQDPLGGRERRIRFQGLAGDLVSYHYNFDAQWQISNVTMRDSTGAEVPRPTVRAGYDLWDLPGDGTYYLCFSTVQTTPAYAGVGIDRQIEIELAQNAPADFTLEEAQAAVLHVDAAEAEDLSFAISGNGGNVTLTGPNGLIEQDLAAGWIHRVRSTVPGRYTVQFVGEGTRTVAASTPRVFEAVPNGEPADLSGLVPGQVAQVRFTAQAGDVIGVWRPGYLDGAPGFLSGILTLDGVPTPTPALGDVETIQAMGTYYVESVPQYSWDVLGSPQIARAQRVELVAGQPPVAFAISKPLQAVVGRFNTEGKKPMVFTVGSSTFDPWVTFNFVFTSPDGTQVIYQDSGMQGYFTPPAPGTYEVRVLAYKQALGTGTLSLSVL